MFPYLQLTTINPGAQTWIAQLNANTDQIDRTQPYIRTEVAGTTLSILEAVAIGTDGKLAKADANGSAFTFNMIGVVLSNGVLNDLLRVQRLGEIPFTHASTPGAPLYLSDTPGILSVTPGSVVRIVGQLLGGNRAYIDPARSWAAS